MPPDKTLELQPAPSPGGLQAALTATSWAPRDELPVTHWVQQGRWLGTLGRATGWWIGDWIRYGNARYGDRYVAAAALTGYDVQSLMNMAYVAGRFDSGRRRPGLSFSHHAEVAALVPEDQELWLDRAEASGLSVRALRLELRDARQRVESRLARAERRKLVPVSRAPPEPQPVCPRCGHRLEPGGSAPRSARAS